MRRAAHALTPIRTVPAVPVVGHSTSDPPLASADDAESNRLTCDTPSIVGGLGPVADGTHSRFAEPVLSTAVTHASCDGSSEVGRNSSDAPVHTADLILLHAALGHYARQLWDIQKVRVAMTNRVAAMERDGLPDHMTAHARATMDGLDKLEADINRYLERSARRHPMADWIKAQRGIGLPGFARLLGITGPLDRFATVSKLWAYLGMHVVDGAAPKRRKGELANWSPQGRVLCHQVADAIVKVGGDGPYRAAYDRKKAHYETDRPEWTQARRHNAAMRYAVKELLKAMWIEWHRIMPHPAPRGGETPCDD